MGAPEIDTEWRPLGSLLREEGVVREEEVEEALAEQEHSGEPLGEILLGWGFVSRPLLTRVLAGQRGEWLGPAFQRQLGAGIGALQRRPRAVHALQRPGVAVRPAQLALHDGCLPRIVRDRLEEFVQPRHAEGAARLELGQPVA